MGNAKRENSLLFCALTLFFFVFLESTLFFQTNLAQHRGHGPFLSQLPIQGASTLGLLAFPLKNRLVGEKADRCSWEPSPSLGSRALSASLSHPRRW